MQDLGVAEADGPFVVEVEGSPDSSPFRARPAPGDGHGRVNSRLRAMNRPLLAAELERAVRHAELEDGDLLLRDAEFFANPSSTIRRGRVTRIELLARLAGIIRLAFPDRAELILQHLVNAFFPHGVAGSLGFVASPNVPASRTEGLIQNRCSGFEELDTRPEFYPSLVVIEPALSRHFGLRIIIAEELTIGRSGAGTTGVVLDDPAISRRHFTAINTPAIVLLRDEQSTNGTFVKGSGTAGQSVRIQTAILSDGDEVRCGRHVLSYVARRIKGV